MKESLHTVAGFKEFIRGAYRESALDRLVDTGDGVSPLDRGMYRWFRLSGALRESGIDERSSVLDVGAFPFTALKVVQALYPDVAIHGCGLWGDDVSQMLASDPGLKGGSFHECNLDPWIVTRENQKSIPSRCAIADNSIDFVIFTEVIEHLYNPAHALKEIFRVLKPGGRLYLTTNNVTYWFYALRILRGETNLDQDLSQITVDFENEYPHHWRGHVRFYSISQVISMLRLAGVGTVIRATSYDTTDILPGQRTFSKQLRTWVKGLINLIPCMNRFRGHIEIVAEKAP